MAWRITTDLKPAARAYVVAVIATSLAVFGACLPLQFRSPELFAILLVLSAAAGAFKIRLPLYSGGSTLSVAFAFDFTALLLLDRPEAMLVAGAGALAQCTIRVAEDYPLYRTVFSVATVSLSIAMASVVFFALGGAQTLDPPLAMIVPVLGAATAFFFLNSLIVGIAVASSTGQSLRRVWYENLLWGAPGYIIGALMSAGLAVLILQHGTLIAPVIFIPAYLSYHAYQVYVGRIEAEQLHVRQVSELHQAASEALAIARQSEQALAAEKEQLAVTLRSIADAVLTVDTDGRVQLMNRVAEELTGWTQETAVGQPLAAVVSIVHRETGHLLPSPIEHVLNADQAVERVTSAALVTDGLRRLIEWTATPMHDRAGVVMGVVLVLRDVTVEVRAEEERARSSKLESLGILAGGIAHDFNNIMTAIIGNLSLVSMSPTLDAGTARRIAEAERACERARSLTKQLLTFSKGGAPVKSPTALSPVVQEAASFALRGSNVRPEFDMADDLWHVEADAGQLTQVIHNIVINAKQAMPGGGVVRLTGTNVTREVERAGEPLPIGDYVRIEIEDHGCGIPAHLLQKVFDPYFTTKPDGSGLGLASSYSIVRSHGGHIGMESTPGEGTIVQIYLPRTFATPAVAAAIEPTRSSHTRGRVLVMDDEDAIRELAGEMLEALGFEPVLTPDGEAAIRAFEAARDQGDPFAVVIMDLTIPGGMGGKDAVRRVREIDPSVRAIVSSGYADDPVMADFRAYGFDGVVAKPYTVKDLGRALDVLLEGA
ncbi:MAG: ATP-binding protein [Vicinamibacterales bacterium]